jgi:hypothetical protein
MSLIAVHTIEINGKEDRGLVALNTGNISMLEDIDGKAQFQFIPFGSQRYIYLIEESIMHIFNAPVQYGSAFNLTFTTVGGTLNVTRTNILRVYPHSSIDRTYMEVLSGTTSDVHVIKQKMLEVIWEANKIQ